MKAWVIFVLGWLVSGCVQTDTTATRQAPATAQQRQIAGEPVDLNWVEYADPVADANLAAAKENFNLLALSQNVTQIPGVDLQQFSLETLRKTCGFSYVKGMDDPLFRDADSARRQQLLQYAEAFNQVMISECLKHTSL